MKIGFIDKYFLGGTCANSTWRDEWIEKNNGKLNFFNPVVDVWDESAQATEDKEKALCGIHLYGLTAEQQGAYSFFEIAYSLYNNKDVVLLILGIDKNEQYHSTINKIIGDLSNNKSVRIFYSIDDFFKSIT